MKRRTVLATVALSTGVAGCLGSWGDSDEPVASPALVEIANNTGESVTIQVQTEKDGEQVHDEQYTVEAVTIEEGDDIDSYVSVDGVQIVEDWMASAAEFEFRFTVPEHGLETSFTSDDPIGNHENASQSELDGKCYFVRVAVGDERDVVTPNLDATPEQLFTWAVVYDHDVFDRPHAGDCS